jgi:DNA-binding NtrC family response regulator
MNSSDPAPASNTRAGLLSRGSFILVVDDDPEVLKMIEAILGAQGWTVKAALDAAGAFALIESSPTPPVLVICDVIMKGIDGLELARRLLARVPRLRAIFISGHLADVSWWPKDLRQCPFLPKPFTNEELIAAVREALSS